MTKLVGTSQRVWREPCPLQANTLPCIRRFHFRLRLVIGSVQTHDAIDHLDPNNLPKTDLAEIRVTGSESSSTELPPGSNPQQAGRLQRPGPSRLMHQQQWSYVLALLPTGPVQLRSDPGQP